VGELEATQFSTTTKLKGYSAWVMGGNRFKGSSSRLRNNSNAKYGGTVLITTCSWSWKHHSVARIS